MPPRTARSNVTRKSKTPRSPGVASSAVGFVSLLILAACGGNGGIATFTGVPDASTHHKVTGSSGGGSGSGAASDDGSGSTDDASDDAGATDGGDDGGGDASPDDGGGDASPDDGGDAGEDANEDGAASSDDGSTDASTDATMMGAGDAATGSDGAGDASGGNPVDATVGDSSGGGSGGGDAGTADSGGADGGGPGGDAGHGITDAGGSGAVDSGNPTDAGSTTHDGSVDSGADAGKNAGGCNLSGAWALKVTATVSWSATGLVGAGSNQTIYLWALMQESQSGNTLTTTVLPCGLTLPDFSLALVATYGVTVPNALFDGTDLTAAPTTLTVSSSAPGATFSGLATASLLGISLSNPTTATWPSLATAESDEVDMDHDGYPGVTTLVKSGGIYSPIPTSLDILDLSFADQLYMTLRSVVSLSGSLTSCTEAQGTATVSHLDNHVIGCHIDGQPQTDAGANHCTADQATFVDGNSPALVANSATFDSVLLADAPTCPDVRAALP